MVEDRRHFFVDCGTFSLQKSQDMKTSMIELVTCQECKRRILGELEKQDWRLLDESEIYVLETAATQATKR